MANVAKQAILRAKLAGALTDLLPKTVTDNVYVNETTTLTVFLATLAKESDLQTLQNTVNALGALAKKNKVTTDDLDTALAALINGAATKQALSTFADTTNRTFEQFDETIVAYQQKVNTLVGGDMGKSARTIANEELAKQLIAPGADASLDTLAKIAAWIQEHPDDAAAMNNAITALQNQLSGIAAGNGTVKKYVDAAIAALKIGDYAKAADLTALAERVVVVEETMNEMGALAFKNTVGENILDAALKEKVNAAAEGNHSHDNKSVLDGITAALISNWNDANTKKHTHSNKAVLDGITADKVSAWDGKATFYCSSDEPAGMVDGDIWARIIE